MARARLLKPGFFTNDQLGELQPLARLLFAGMWTIADREGRLEDRPRRIRAEVLPYDDVDADGLLDELAAHGFVTRYEEAGQRLVQITSFAKHQSPHPKEPASQLPAMGESVLSNGLDSDETVCSPSVAVAVAGSSVAEAVEAVASNADKSAPTPMRSRKAAVVPLSKEELEILRTEFDDFPDVDEQIGLATSHDAAKKYPTNQIGYTRNWLRRERGYRAERSNGNGKRNVQGNHDSDSDKFRNEQIERWI